MSIHIRPIDPVARLADLFLRPFMYLLAGTFREAPQETHRWNNVRLADEDVAQLDSTLLVSAQGDKTATKRWFFTFLPLFHCPIFGGWRNYVVIEPTEHTIEWYVGWLADGVNGVSLLPIKGGVRVLEGPGPTSWFGVNKNGHQISLRLLGKGRIGMGGCYTHLPLR